MGATGVGMKPAPKMQSKEAIRDSGGWGLLDDSPEFGVETMLAFVNFEAILEDELGLLGGGAQFGECAFAACPKVLVIQELHGGARQALQGILQFSDALSDFRGGGLRLHVSVERDFAFNLLDVFSDESLAVVDRMNDLGNDARK